MKSLVAFNLQEFVDKHRESLQPPVCNLQVFDEDDFIVMVVGGPNSRRDYHVDDGPELFYQLEGDMLLKIFDDGEFNEIPIRSGEILLLPPRVPHSPQRFAASIGLVVERKRLDNELDGFIWFCDNCGNKLYEEFVHLNDIVAQLPPLFERYYETEEHRSCGRCGTVMPTQLTDNDDHEIRR